MAEEAKCCPPPSPRIYAPFFGAAVSGGAAGLAREVFFSADNYFLTVSPQFAEQPMAKMLLLAATLAVDIIYKSESRGTTVTKLAACLSAGWQGS